MSNDGNNEYIQLKWHSLASSFTQEQQIADSYLQEIVTAYSQPGRHYHNLAHIAHMLRLSDEYATSLADKAVVDLSIFYHDFIYKVPGSDNEHKSALYAATHLPALGVPEIKVQEVKAFIEATKTHELVQVANPGDLQYFLDFDMAILAADWEEYVLYFKNVRKEYKYYPDLLYYPGRKDFLKKTLAKDKIFYTHEFRSRLEEKARKNLDGELSYRK